jgi:predicted Zn-dependent protease with MMP-like domain
VSDNEDDIVTSEERRLFDELFDEELASLPQSLRDKLEEVPVIVEDCPSDDLLEEMEIDDPGSLCGLHTGVPLTERSVDHSGTIPDTIQLFREGILNQSLDDEGYIDEAELRRQIRITLLHEIGHHFGLSEEDLGELGYG